VASDQKQRPTAPSSFESKLSFEDTSKSCYLLKLRVVIFKLRITN